MQLRCEPFCKMAKRGGDRAIIDMPGLLKCEQIVKIAML